MNGCHNLIYGAEFHREDIEEAVRLGGLLSMEVEFGRKCNFRCSYCYVSGNHTQGEELTAEEFKGAISQARDLGARKIIVLGGEPMLYGRISEMLGFIWDLGLSTEIFTNGTNMSEGRAGELYEKGVTVVLKMNTFNERIQDALSGRKGAFRQIKNAFENLRKAGYPSAEARLGVSTVICRQNIDELPALWQWLREQDISPYFEMITPQGRAKGNGSLEVETGRLKELFDRISEIDRTKFGRIWEPQPPLVGGKCLRQRFSLVLNSRGDVMPCVGVNIAVGNVREKPLKDIISESEVIQDLRKYKKTIKGPCSECKRLDECYGCRGAAYQLTGDYLASDPLCWENAERLGEIVHLPAAIDGYLPHKRPMLVVERILELGERSSVSEFEVPEDSIFIEKDGTLSASFYPEMVSQSIAALNGFRNPNGGGKEGFLIGINNFETEGSAKAGDVLRVRVFKSARYGDFSVIKAEVLNGERKIAKGEIKVWQKKGDGDEK